MSIPTSPCAICQNQTNDKLVCKSCLNEWIERFGNKNNRANAETTAKKINQTSSVRFDDIFPENTLAKRYGK